MKGIDVRMIANELSNIRRELLEGIGADGVGADPMWESYAHLVAAERELYKVAQKLRASE